MSLSTDHETQLRTYGKQLATAGFEVWITGHGRSSYLQYRDPATGNCGSLQQTDHFGSFQHLMPLVPSREYGSAMHLDTDLDPFTVEAARECAQPTNRNSVVGTQRNAGDRQWRSPSAVALHTT